MFETPKAVTLSLLAMLDSPQAVDCNPLAVVEVPNAVAMPAGTNGQILYVITSGTGSIDINGEVGIATPAKLTYIYAGAAWVKVAAL